MGVLAADEIAVGLGIAIMRRSIARLFYFVKLAPLQRADHRALGDTDSHRDSAVGCVYRLCHLPSQFEAHPVMVKVAAVQQYLPADRTFDDKTLAFVETDGALIVRANPQIDLVDDASAASPGNERR